MALYHTVKGPVNYTVVGSPTIVDGVVSDITSSDRLRLLDSLSFGANDDVEYNFVFTTGQTISTQWLFGLLYSNTWCGIYIDSTGIRVPFTVDNGSMKTCSLNYAVSSSTKYRINVKRVNGTVTSSLYNATDTLLISNTASIPYSLNSSNNTIGTNPSYSYGGAWGGSIDLNSTYIKVNGAAWFGTCPVEVKHINYGTSVGYTKVGSPTITDGIASGFSSSDYLQTNSNLPSNSNMEFNIKFTAGVSGGIQGILGSPANNIYFGVKLMSYNQLDIILSYDGGNTDNVLDTKISQNTTYSLNCKLTNNKLLASLKNASGEELEYKEFDFSHELRQTAISFGYSGTSTYFNGSIDLNETYIKVNGKLWFFQPCTNYLIHKANNVEKLVFADSNLYLSGPVNYSVVGTPTIEDNVASGFVDNTNYLTSSSFTSLDTSDVEQKIYFTTGSSVTESVQWIYSRNQNGQTLGAYIGTSGKVAVPFVENGGSSILVSPNYVLSPSTYYSLLISRVNGTVTATLYDANGASLASNSVSAPYAFTGTGLTYWGVTASGAHNLHFEGSIDFNNTYIKVDDSLWFYGKNYASQNIAPVPSGFNYGTTTTNAIGWVDMRTQSFTAAPTGTTMGSDE